MLTQIKTDKGSEKKKKINNNGNMELNSSVH